MSTQYVISVRGRFGDTFSSVSFDLSIVNNKRDITETTTDSNFDNYSQVEQCGLVRRGIWVMIISNTN